MRRRRLRASAMKFRLALVGAGRIGAFHAVALRDSAIVEVAAVVDPRSDAGAELGEVRRYRSLAELVERGGIDGALVAVPTRHHRATVAELVAAGLPVLCEKPCGMTSNESRAIGEDVERAGGLLHVAFWRRYVNALGDARARVRGGELGELFSIFSAQWDEHPPSAGFRDPASSGGICVDCGVHDFDLLRWLTGQEIEAVSGHASTVCSVAPVAGDPESASLVARLSGGTTALINLGRRHPPGELQSLQVIGTRGAVNLTYVEETDSPVVLDAFRRQTEDFARAAGGASTDLATVEDATHALRAAELAVEAIRPDVERAPERAAVA